MTFVDINQTPVKDKNTATIPINLKAYSLQPAKSMQTLKASIM